MIGGFLINVFLYATVVSTIRDLSAGGLRGGTFEVIFLGLVRSSLVRSLSSEIEATGVMVSTNISGPPRRSEAYSQRSLDLLAVAEVDSRADIRLATEKVSEIEQRKKKLLVLIAKRKISTRY